MSRLEVAFKTYHFNNPHIYNQFESMAFALIRAGRNHYGAKAIFEAMRYETAISGNDDFKINNNYTSRYVRMFDKAHPGFSGFFRKRLLTS